MLRAPAVLRYFGKVRPATYGATIWTAPSVSRTRAGVAPAAASWAGGGWAVRWPRTPRCGTGRSAPAPPGPASGGSRDGYSCRRRRWAGRCRPSGSPVARCAARPGHRRAVQRDRADDRPPRRPGKCGRRRMGCAAAQWLHQGADV